MASRDIFVFALAITGCVAWGQTMSVRITDGAARVRLRDPAGNLQPVKIAGAVAAHPRFPELGAVVEGELAMDAPGKGYSIVVDRGAEYIPQTLPATSATRTVTLQRWIDMPGRGWWAGDLHVHRTPAEMPPLMEAAGISFAPVITRWNLNSNLDSWPEQPLIRAGESRYYSVNNAEDERDWGAALFLNLRSPIALYGRNAMWPPPTDTWKEARDKGAFIDQEKIIWWAAPIVAALAPPDSVGVANNHFLEEGMLENEAWGRPRDRAKYPGFRGFADYILDLYSMYLSAGLRVPASAGSANGVLRSPLGYSRSYVYLGERFSPDAWLEGQKAGRNFVTNGPMLFLTVNGRMPGAALRANTKSISVELTALSRDELERVDVLVSGNVVRSLRPGHSKSEVKISFQVPVNDGDWIAARCFEPHPQTVRFAHTSPVYVGPAPRRDPQALARIEEWIDTYAEVLRKMPEKALNETQRAHWLDLCRQAREAWLR